MMNFSENSEDSQLGKSYNKTVNYTNWRITENDGAETYNTLRDNENFWKENVYFGAYGFERFIYLNVWVALVILTALINILVMWVLLQKKMRSVTNFLLVVLAMSDSLTGLVILPTFIMVFRKADSTTPLESICVYTLSKMLCSAFTISISFLSQSFHTISIWLTLFLGIQRYISVAYPFKTQVWFTTRKTAIVVVLICVFSPMLHVYNLLREKTRDGYCGLALKDGAFVQIWIALLLLNFIPCLALTITTLLFIRNLNKNSFQPTNPMSTSSNEDTRSRENRRMSMIVVAIAILSLITELPYGLFILCMTIISQSSIDNKTFARIDVTHEITLVLSYHLNFYIYTFLNKRFRSYLRETLGTFSSRLNNFCLSTRASSSGDERNIQGTTENKDLLDTQDSTRHGNQVIESVL